jgi:hypothetical protein
VGKKGSTYLVTISIFAIISRNKQRNLKPKRNNYKNHKKRKNERAEIGKEVVAPVFRPSLLKSFKKFFNR